MKTGQLILFFILLCSHTVQAQKTWTLEECVSYALQNRESIKNQLLDQEIAEGKLAQAYSQLYPQVKGTGDMRDNLILPTTILPGEFAGRPNEEIELQFGLKYNATAALDANWVLYNPELFAQVKSLKQSTQVSAENTELQKRTIRFDVALSYYGALLAQERITLQQELLNKYTKNDQDAQALYTNQQLSLLDKQQAEWNVKNQQAEVERAKQSLEKSLYQLKYKMGYSADSSLMLSDPISLYTIASHDGNAIADYNNRPEYKIIQLQLQQEIQNRKKFQSSFLPTLSAYGYWGTQAFRPQFDFFTPSAKWYNVSYVGLKLSLPVFDGFLKGRQIVESKKIKEKKENELSAFEKQYRYEIENSKRNMDNAQKLLEIRKNNLEFAKEQRRIMELRYQEGLVKMKDLSDSNANVAEAQNTYLTAFHDYLVAALEFEKVK